MTRYIEFIRELNSQAKRTQIAIAAVALLIGLLIVTQIRVQQNASKALQASTEEDLGRIVSSLNNETNMLRVESAQLKLQLFKIERDSNDSSAVMKDSFKNLNNLKIIAGLTQVTGPGIRIQITDENLDITASDLLDIITELRVGGAEAIEINGARVVARTGVREDKDGIYVDQKLVSQPYEVLAIGEPEGLNGELIIAGGVRDKVSAHSGVTFNITKENNIIINSVASNE